MEERFAVNEEMDRCWICGEEAEYETDRGIPLCERHARCVPSVMETIEEWARRVGAKHVPPRYLSSAEA